MPNPTKSWGELRCFGRLNSSCSTTDTSCSVHLSFFYFFLCPILLRNWIVHFLLPLKLFCICLGRYISQRNLVKHTDHLVLPVIMSIAIVRVSSAYYNSQRVLPHLVLFIHLYANWTTFLFNYSLGNHILSYRL